MISFTLDILASMLSRGKGPTKLNLLKGPLMSSYGSVRSLKVARVRRSSELNSSKKTKLLWNELKHFSTNSAHNLISFSIKTKLAEVSLKFMIFIMFLLFWLKLRYLWNSTIWKIFMKKLKWNLSEF
jgi:hypothetical protein